MMWLRLMRFYLEGKSDKNMRHQYTQAEFENVRKWIVASLQRFIEIDGDLLKPESIIPNAPKLKGEKEKDRKLHELVLNHRLAVHLEYLIETYGIYGYHIDTDYNRYFKYLKKVKSWETGEEIEEVRPDIIVHKRIRQESVPHFLVVEAKKMGLIPKDCNHVKDLMHDENYLYKYGMLISYYEDPAIKVNLLTLPNDEFCEHVFSINH